MGLAASQVRMLSLTSRRASIERDMLRDSNRKVALSREMNNLANEYYDALSAERLMYLSDAGEYRNLSYQYLMGRPGGIEDIDVKSDNSMLLIDTLSGKVVLNDKMAEKIHYSQSELASDSQNIYLAIASLCGDRNIVRPDGCTDELIISPNLVKDICAGKFDNFDIEDLTNAINNPNYHFYSPDPVIFWNTVEVVDEAAAIQRMNNVSIDERDLDRVNSWINTGNYYDLTPGTSPMNTSAYNLDNSYVSDLYTINSWTTDDDIINSYFSGDGFTFGTYSSDTVATNYLNLNLPNLSEEVAQAKANEAKAEERANIENRIKNFARGMATAYFGVQTYNDLSLQQKMAVAAVLKSFSVGDCKEPLIASTELDSNLYNRTDYATMVNTSVGNLNDNTPETYEIRFDTTLFLNALQVAYESTQTGGEFHLENYSISQNVFNHYNTAYNEQSGQVYTFGSARTTDFELKTPNATTMAVGNPANNSGNYMYNTSVEQYGYYNTEAGPSTLNLIGYRDQYATVKFDYMPSSSQVVNQGHDGFDFYTDGTVPLYSTYDNLYYLSSRDGGNHLVQIGSLGDYVHNSQGAEADQNKVLNIFLNRLVNELELTLPRNLSSEQFTYATIMHTVAEDSSSSNFSGATINTKNEFNSGETLNIDDTNASLTAYRTNSDVTNIRDYEEEDGHGHNNVYGTEISLIKPEAISNALDGVNQSSGGYSSMPMLGYSDGSNYYGNEGGHGNENHSEYELDELHLVNDTSILRTIAYNQGLTDSSNLFIFKNLPDTSKLQIYAMRSADDNAVFYYADATALINYFYAQVLGENIGYGYDSNGNFEYLSPMSYDATDVQTGNTLMVEAGDPGDFTPYLTGENLSKVLRMQSDDKQNIFATAITTQSSEHYIANEYMYNNNPLQFCPAGEVETQWIQNFKDLIKDVKFYYTIVTACAKFGYTTDYAANLDDSEYLDKNIQNGIFQLMGFETDVFSLNSAKDTDYYLLTSEFSKMNDPAQQAIITAWYESEKAEINAKETYLDTQIENLSVELNSIKTEIESVKTLIDDAVKQNFDWGKG